MAQSDPRFLSRPCRVIFAGFESDTYSLQRAGWRLSAEQDIQRGRINLAMSYEPCELYIFCEEQSFNFRGYHADSWRFDENRLPVFIAKRAFSKKTLIHANNFDANKWAPIDAMEVIVETKVKTMADFNLFAAPLARTEEIIVEPQSVSECLDLIRKMQAPDLTKIRERNRRREAGEAMNQEIFHAQILSLAA